MTTDFLFRKVDAAPLAVYRILMGILMAAEGWGAVLTGWVKTNYVDVPFTFNFIGFDFLQVMVGPQAYIIYFLLGVFGIGIAMGYRYRLMVLGYTILWAAVYFGQKSSYNNHYYLLLLTSMLLCVIPAHHFASMDVKQGRVEHSETVPYWSVWIIKVLLLIVYVYASIAKIYPDWLSGKTVGVFFGHKTEWPIIGPLCDQQWFILLISYGGIIFDLLVIPALWYKPTRKYAFIISIFFHGFNSIVFRIGIFPFMMLIATVLYFEPKTIRRIFLKSRAFSGEEGHTFPTLAKKRLVLIGLGAFLFVQLVLPLRPHYFPGSSHWTEEGHRLSWHMMLRSKSGIIHFTARDSTTGLEERVFAEKTLPPKLARSITTRPDIAWQYAQRLKKEYIANGHPNVEIYARNSVRLNGRPFETLIDPDVNLATEDWNPWKSHEWILHHPDL